MRSMIAILGLAAFAVEFGGQKRCSAESRRIEGLDVVALSGQVAAGATDAIWDRFFGGATTITGSGLIAFGAGLDGPQITDANRDGIWARRENGLELAFRNGQTTPDALGGGTAESMSEFGISNDGRVIARVDLTSRDDALWSYENGQRSTLARERGAAPGTDQTFVSIFPPLLSAGGHVAFLSSLSGPTSSFVTSWWERDGLLSILARQGDIAPGLEPDTRFGLSGSPMGISNNGDVAFTIDLQRPEHPNGRTSIWRSRNGNLELVARNGDIAPGTGSHFASYSSTIVSNGLLDIAFQATLGGDGVTDENRESIWIDQSGAKRLIVRGGQFAPEMSEEARFNQLGPFVLNREGRVAFSASTRVVGGTNSTISTWMSDTSGEIDRIMSFGETSPDPDCPGSFQTTRAQFITADGRLILYADMSLNGSSRPPSLWVYEPLSDALRCLVAPGDRIVVADNDERQIIGLSIIESSRTNGENGVPASINWKGQIAFEARFTDGSQGVFIMNSIAIPEPSTYTFVVLAIAAFALLHRRRFDAKQPISVSRPRL